MNYLCTCNYQLKEDALNEEPPLEYSYLPRDELRQRGERRSSHQLGRDSKSCLSRMAFRVKEPIFCILSLRNRKQCEIISVK